MSRYWLFAFVVLVAKSTALPTVSDGKCCVGPCTAPLEKYYSIAKSMSGQTNCGECCMNPKDYWKFKIFEPHLAKATSNTVCADNGFTVYETTPTHGFGPLKITLDLYKKASAEESNNATNSDVTLYKIQGAECGQVALDSKIAPFAEKAAGLKEGTCSSQGYTVADGKQTMKIPVVGTTVTIYKFKKPSVLASTGLPLTRFDGSSADFDWIEENDPVMGGKSTNCTFTKDKSNQVGIFTGVVELVPSLKAPGFCFARSRGLHKLGDASKYTHLEIEYKSDVAYKGFKAAFVADTWNTQFGAFKADFSVQATTGFEKVQIPFSSFSNKWSSATGEPTRKSPPSAKNLRDISQLQIWAEGTKGPFNLAIKQISAVSGSSSVCKATEYCCPDAKRCLTPTKTSCDWASAFASFTPAVELP